MLRFITLIVLLILCFIGLYQLSQHPYIKHNSIQDRLLHPFDPRIRYSIGDIDPRFGITEYELLQLAEQATHIWQQATPEPLFIYDPQAKLKIHLIYDERQSKSNARQQQMSDIEQQQHNWLNQHEKLQQLKQQLQQQNQQLNQKQQQLQQAIQNYNVYVQQLNQNGGVQPSQKAQLEQEKQNLNLKRQKLAEESKQYNQKIQDLNQQVNQLNQLHHNLENHVSHFNQRFQPRPFDKAVFNGKDIVIYEFRSQADLKLTLAHEFGHALGLAHHNDPLGLMYPMLDQQTQQNFQLSTADLALLQQH